MSRRYDFSRRRFLQGAGVLMALPFLESIAPRSTAHAAPSGPKRFLAYYVPCGIVMKNWTPSTEGMAYALTTILAPIANVKSKVLVVSGLANRPAKPDGPGDHASGTGAFITCAHPRKTDGTDISNGISADQIAAGVLGAKSKFDSLQLGMDGGASVGGCDSGYSCAYARNISWASATTPLPKLTNPQTVFDRMFDPKSLDPKAAMKRRFYKKSVLDFVIEDARRLQMRLAKTDAHKLDEYQTGVRELETRIDNSVGGVCQAPMRPADAQSFPQQIQNMSDLMALAFQCDMTRVITFMLGNAGSGRSYPFLGVNNGHHELSHHMGDPNKLAALTVIGTWEVKQFAYLAEKLAKMDDGGGKTVLDNTVMFFSSEIEDGNTHSHFNMPILVAGSAGGVLKTGRHVAFKKQEPVANLMVTLLGALGVKAPGFGDSTGALTDLLA